MLFDQVYAFSIIGHVWSMALQPDHIQGLSRFEGSMDVEVFSGILRLVEVC